MKVLITGASGLLGRAVMKTAKTKDWDVVGIAHQRSGPELESVDLLIQEDVRALMERVRPDYVIHTAAIRSPDIVEHDFPRARKFNVSVTEDLTSIAKSLGCRVVYISTDYVFDGNNAPYSETDTPCPVNKYGSTKLDGEKAVMAADPTSLVLRIPVLYGPVEYVNESAVTCLLNTLKGPPAVVSHYERRYPAHVDAVADILCQLLDKVQQDPTLCGIFQWSGLQMFTKYDMCVVMAEALELSVKHIEASDVPIPGVPRPYDSRMLNTRLLNLGITSHVPFRDGIRDSMQKWL